MLGMLRVFSRSWWEGSVSTAWPIPLLMHHLSLAKPGTCVPPLRRALLAGVQAGTKLPFEGFSVESGVWTRGWEGSRSELTSLCVPCQFVETKRNPLTLLQGILGECVSCLTL